MASDLCITCGANEARLATKWCLLCLKSRYLAEALAIPRPKLQKLPAAKPRRAPEPVAEEPEPAPRPEPEPTSPANPYSGAVVTGVRQGLHLGTQVLLLAASKFAATLGSVPHEVNAAQAFLDFNQKHFYNHMRTMLKALDGRKKLPGSRRVKPPRKTPAGAHSVGNKRLALALRYLRIYMQMEMKPLALMLGKSHAAIWHIECANHNILPEVVAAYADVFGVDSRSIYRYANALGRGPAKDLDPADMITKFVDCVLRPK